MDHGRLLDGRLKIRHLILVTEIADAGSVVRAAEAMHVTQPVVTRGLRDVEEILGVSLFERLPRGVTPTPYGELFLEHARAILAQLRSADEQVQLLRTGELGTVVVGTHLAGSNLLLPRAIAALKAEHPRVIVSVREATPDSLQQQLLAGAVDLVVGRLTPKTSNRLRQEKLHEEPIRLVARLGHPAHAMDNPALADLTAFPWVIPVAQTALRAEIERAFMDQGVSLPEDRVECTSILTLRQLLVSTDVIAALPMFVATEDAALRLLPTGLSSIRRSVGVTMGTDRPPSPAARLLLRHLREQGAAIAELADQ
jgi:DNA-binding transcriptional LysR family regulator